MSNYDDEQKAMEAAIADEEWGLALETAGGAILCFCSITCLWIFVGWRAGTWLWFWCTLGLVLIGATLASVGSWLRGRGAANFAAVASIVRSRVVAASASQELPREGMGPKAA